MSNSRDTKKIDKEKKILSSTLWERAFKSSSWGDIKKAEVISKLGKGAYGVVHKYKLLIEEKEKKKHQEVTVAVKTAKSSNSRKELGLLDKINYMQHPNIINHYAAFSQDTTIMLMMELVPDQLTNVIDPKKTPDFPWITRYKIALGIARAMQFLHENGIVYGDLKPGNVLVDKDKNSKLIDFNLSDESKVHRARGTPLYFAPELVDVYYNGTKNIFNSFETDAYAFGLVLWLIVTRKEQPFEKITSLGKLFEKVVVKKEREIIPENCPPSFASAITFAWMQEPEKRKTMAQLVDDFETAKFYNEIKHYDNRNKMPTHLLQFFHQNKYTKALTQLVKHLEKKNDNKNKPSN